MAELVSIKRNVDVSPGQAAPAVFHCSQGDVGSKIILGLLNNGTAYTIPSGVTVTIEGSESNGSIFTPISATASGSDITFYLTGEMTAVAGPAICQAVLKSGSNILGTANFTLEVESSPMGADAPPVFTDAGWTWMLNKLTTEFVPALGDNIIDAIDSKLDKNQGTANAGKYLKVGADGNVETADLDVTTDKTLSIADKAADAKAVGDELTNLKTDSNYNPYGIEPFQMSLFKQTQNLFSDEFCYHITKSYYRGRTSSSPEGRPRITATPNWQGWLIRIKPNTIYTLGPLDFKLELLDTKFNNDITITEFSTADPNTITTGPNSYWLCLTQETVHDMSSWMMVEGNTYPSEYVSGYPKWIDVPQFPDNQLNHITFAYNAGRINVTYDGNTATIYIPNRTRIFTQKGMVITDPNPTTLTISSAQFICYDMTDGKWTYGSSTSGHERYYIGWIKPDSHRCFFLTTHTETVSKTIAFMGDSITAGVATSTCYHQYLQKKYLFTCLNYGYGGSGYYRSYPGNNAGKLGTGEPGMGVAITSENAFTPNNVVARLSELTPENIDGIVIFAGTNDWGNNVAITDFISGIEAAFEYCATNLTHAPVLVLTPIHRRYDTQPNSQGKTLREYADIIIEECKKYGIAYIDTMTMTGLYPDNEANRLRYFESNQDSGLHPSAEGHKRIASVIGETLKEIIEYTELT